jgi:deoxyribose-phosphate aldolase
MEVRSSIELARLIDHTTLRSDVTETEVEQYCTEALEWQFAAVCVNPIHVPRVAARLAGSPVRTCPVIGFPLGASPTALKRAELDWVLEAGAGEVDMVISVGTLKSRGAGPVGEEIAALKTDCGIVPLKVIIEISLLSDAEIVDVCRAAKAAGADFVKTSTGFVGSGATVKAVSLMRATVGPDMGVKASGGIRSVTDALSLIEAGANRIGTSRGAALVKEARYHLENVNPK